MSKLQARARVRITLDVAIDRPWPEEETVKNVHVSCEREAREIADRIVNTLRGNPTSARPTIMGIHDVQISAIWLEPEK